MSSLEDEATKQGNLLRDKGDFDGAIAAYTEAIRLNPENAQPYSSRGQAYLRKGELDKAIADCNKAIQLDPMMAEAYCCGVIPTAGTATSTRLSPTARRPFASTRTEPRHTARRRFASTRTEPRHTVPEDSSMGRRVMLKEPLRIVQRLFASTRSCLKHSVVEPIFMIGRVSSTRRLRTARRPFGSKCQQCGREGDIAGAEASTRMPGTTRNEKGEFDKAIADFTESIRLDPRHAEVYRGRAYAYPKNGEFDKAIADYNEAIRLNPKYADDVLQSWLGLRQEG